MIRTANEQYKTLSNVLQLRMTSKSLIVEIGILVPSLDAFSSVPLNQVESMTIHSVVGQYADQNDRR
jgi:hypothetical protein